MHRFHLAQVNVARAKDSLDSPVMKGFVDQLEHVNGLADAHPGFVWRLKTDEGDATSLRAFDDDRILVNMSLWRDFASLKSYVYSGDHLEMLRNKKTWFEKMEVPILALWWVPAGVIPSVEDAKRALHRLGVLGPTPEAFTFAKPFPPSPEAEARAIVEAETVEVERLSTASV